MAKLHYGLRPAKYIERHMIADALRRLASGFPMGEYSYVGFGALEFLDFRAIHRALGVTEMISIESDTNASDRYSFNKPYSSVRMEYGWSSAVLPTLNWSSLRIVWLDYECQLRESVLRDCEYLTRSLCPGSVLIVTLNSRPQTSGTRLTSLANAVGDELVPAGLKEQQLNLVGLPRIQRSILGGILRKVARQNTSKTELTQLFNFRYADDAPMQTVGWIVNSPSVRQAVRACRFEDVPYIRMSDDEHETPFAIDVPVLTAKEARHLAELLPLEPGKVLGEKWISAQDQSDFASFYRWYPELLGIA